MTQAVQPFNFGDNLVRVVERDGEPWFVARDVCEVLGIKNSRDAIDRLDDDEKDGVGITDTIGRAQTVSAVSESGLYALIFKSRKPEAKTFRKWVTGEVLPAIRRTGRYAIEGEAEETEPFNRPVTPLELPGYDLQARLRFVAEAGATWGMAGRRRAWQIAGLPDVAPPGIDAPPGGGFDCLAELLDARIGDRTVRDLIARVRGEDDMAAESLLDRHGMKWVDDGTLCGLLVANVNAGLSKLMKGTNWQGGKWRGALSALPGALNSDKRWFGGHQSRAWLVPERIIQADP